MRPTTDRIREALRWEDAASTLRAWLDGETTHPQHIREALLLLAPDALAPPPVEGAAVERVPADAEVEDLRRRLLAHCVEEPGLGCEACVPCRARAALDSLRSQVAAEDAEIERLRRTYGYGEKLAAQLAAAENRGFRAAAEWQQRMLDNGPTRPGAPVHDANQQMIDATLREVTRREGPPESVWPLGDGREDRREGK